MTTEQTAKAERILAACEAALEVCSKATAGPWTLHKELPFIVNGPDGKEVCDSEWKKDAAFIAQARTMTKPALRSTVIGLRLLLSVMGNEEFSTDCPICFEAAEALTAMLDAWPDTI